MDRVIRAERRKTWVWLIGILSLFTVLIIIFEQILDDIINEITVAKSFYPLSVFFQDAWTVSTYWKDSLWIFYEELPKLEIVIAATALILILITIFVVKSKLPIFRKRLNSIRKYSQKGSEI